MSTISNTVLNNLISSYSTEAVAGMGITKKTDQIAPVIALILFISYFREIGHQE